MIVASDNGTSRSQHVYQASFDETTLLPLSVWLKDLSGRLPGQWTTTTSIIDKGIYRFLQHTFSLHDDTWSIQSSKQAKQFVGW